MSDSQQFPVIPKKSISRDDVVNYLLSLREQGHDIYQEEERKDVFFLPINDVVRIRISISGSNCQVQGLQYDSPALGLYNVSNLVQLEKAVGIILHNVLGPRAVKPTSGRLSENTPATNYKTISGLIGSAQIEAVFDPYLDNSALVTLKDITSFGASSIADGIRLLGSDKKSSGTSPTFTKSGADAWLTELGITGESQSMPPNEHRRFMLLSSGETLVLGPSLNAIHKNEAVNTEPDIEDRAFFDGVWSTAVPLV